jgi:hypothetical protein
MEFLELFLGSNMAKIQFVAIERDGCRDGTYGWQVLVDGVEIVPRVSSGNTDVANGEFGPVWEAAGITIDWDWDDEKYAT